jgi:phosphatidylglycerophosphate synthase
MADDLDRTGRSAGHKSEIVEQSRSASESISGDSASRGLRAQIPDALSMLRFALAALWIVLAIGGHAGRVGFTAIAVVAAGSDFIDGRIARILNVASGRGRWLDAIADVTFVLVALCADAFSGKLPFYIPALIALSFAQYAIDSILTAGNESGPIRSRLGHLGGIINYALVIALAVAPPPTLIGKLIAEVASPFLAVFYMAAILERMLEYRIRLFAPPTRRAH